YEMVVIARIGSMKFLPIMNIAMRRPAARVTVRSHVRNRADEPTCIGARQHGCWRRSISDFGGERVWQERQ
ncbi:hypothetical protein QUS91_22520, partial [Xanthomonas citri pv. citri]